MDYIHLNPVRAGLLDPSANQSVMDYPWSSVAAGYTRLPRQRAAWLAAEDGLRAFGYEDTAKGRRDWVERLDARARQEATPSCGLPDASQESSSVDARRSHLWRGWYWGTQGFAEAALKLGEKALKTSRHRSYRASRENLAHGEAQARHMLGEAFQKAGLTKEMLPLLPGSDRRKVAIARAIKEQTTMSLKWIAEHLAMKSAANVSQQIRRHAATP